MRYNGSEKQIKWANDIISIENLEARLIDMLSEIPTLPEKSNRRGRSMSATQKGYFSKKIELLLTNGFAADAVIENRAMIDTVTGLEKAIAYSDAPGIGNVLWVTTKLDMDFQAAMAG